MPSVSALDTSRLSRPVFGLAPFKTENPGYRRYRRSYDAAHAVGDDILPGANLRLLGARYLLIELRTAHALVQTGLPVRRFATRRYLLACFR